MSENTAPAEYVFRRIEKKYLLDREQYERLADRLAPYLMPDKFAESKICNIYYDTYDDLLIRRSIEKPAYKEKLRLRSYGIPDEEDIVFLELKKKWQGVVYKRRTAMPLSAAERYLATGVRAQTGGQIEREMDYFLHFYQPGPKLYLAYDRSAYVTRDVPAVRITFDREIRSRRERLSLAAGDDGERLFPEGQVLMEIKAPEALPVYLTHILAGCGIYATSFSKYGAIYCARQKRGDAEKCS